MAISKCPKCDHHYFEIKENTPTGSTFIVLFVQCSSCGCVVSSVDYFNSGHLLKNDITNMLNDIKNRLARIESEFDYLKRRIT